MSDLARLLAAPLLWLAGFSAVYGLHGAGCGLGWFGIEVFASSLHRLALVGAWLALLVAQVLALLVLRRRSPEGSPALHHASIVLGWTALAAALWTLFPVALLSTCG